MQDRSKQPENLPEEIPDSTLTEEPQKPRHRRHWLPGWIRIPLRVLVALILLILLIPVLIYLPPVQDVLKDIACDYATEATGMKIEIGRFRLAWPLDVALDDVKIVELSGDTMVDARSLVVDVKIKPLFDKQIRLNGLRLNDGYYRMVSSDSSMIMKLRAGLLDVDGRSSFSLGDLNLDLNRARLRDANVSMYMDVWKKQPTPPDSVTPTTPFVIKAGDLQLENISFAMSMLPTIDTLTLRTDRLRLQEAVIDLGTNNINAKYLGADGGAFTYITPTAEYIKTHPAPIDTISPPSPPMTIMADSISLDNFDVLYAVKGAKPQPGFDASYLSLSGVCVSLADFYNKSATLRVPIRRLMGRERSGLQITSATGLFTIDSIGMTLQNIDLRTPNTQLLATADVPFALMELNPKAPVSVEAKGRIGFADVNAFMPAFKEYTSMLRPANQLLLTLDAAGTLSSLRVGRLEADLPGVFALKGRGKVDNPLSTAKMSGNVDFVASLTAPEVAQRMAGIKDVNIPRFSIDGTASIAGQTYAADFTMRSSAGDLAADGRVSLNSETYTADVTAHNLNVGHIMPSLGVGIVTADLSATGRGFNPITPRASTDIRLDVARADYGGHSYTGIHGTVGLANGAFDVDLVSNDPDACGSIKGSGSLATNLYTADIHAALSHLDLKALGFSETESNGYADVYVDGTASPDRWLYDMRLRVDNFGWHTPEQTIELPVALEGYVLATADEVDLRLDTDGASVEFNSPTSLKKIVDKFTALAPLLEHQIKEKNLDVDAIQKIMPDFALHLNSTGKGVVRQLLEPQGLSLDTVYATITNVDSLLNGDIGVHNLVTTSVKIDTVTLGLHQRGSLLDYALHIGNRPGTLPEFAQGNLTGYMGGNRLSAYLNQQNETGQIGYRLGFTAALMDSTVTVHFTPLKATIAYLPWTFNLDNHVDYNLTTRHVDAKLMASSAESSILLMTQTDTDGRDALHLNLTNIHVQDFMKMIVNAPPVMADVNADFNVKYYDRQFEGDGRLDISGFQYDRQKVGDFTLGFGASIGMDGNTDAMATLVVEGQEVMDVQGIIKGEPGATNPNDFTLHLTQFPLSMANPFIGKDVAQLAGGLNGELKLDGEFSKPLLNGQLSFEKASVTIPMMGSAIYLSDTPITVAGNVVKFNQFELRGQNENPLTINGSVNASDFSKVLIDLHAAADNFQLLNNDRRSKADLYGKLFMNLTADVVGSLSVLDVTANLAVLNTTDVTYNLVTTQNALQQNQASEVVKFVNFSDTTQVAEKDSVESTMAMRIRAGATINPGTKATVNITTDGAGSGKVQLTPSGTLNFFQNYMGDMTLSGQLNIGEGTARYNIPVMGEKLFTFYPDSYVRWNGAVMNPLLNIRAFDNVKVNVSQSGNARLVPFLVILNIGNNLEQPQVMFDLEAEGDLSISNELQSMTAEQRSAQAMNMLITGQYTGQNTKTVSGNIAYSALYSFLTSKLNSWAANNIKGVDLSFGVDQYDQTLNGETGTTTSYSYQVSKSLFNNKFKIVVGGNYSTDASADENFAENLVSNVSFEYLLKQTNSLTMLAKLFRHNDYESVLEGEVSEMGAGFVMRRKMSNLRRFFRVRFGRRKSAPAVAADTVTESADSIQPTETSEK